MLSGLIKNKAQLFRKYNELLENISYVFVLRVAQQIINFTSFFFLVHYVSKDVIGHYYFVLSVMGVVSITTLPGMNVALIQSIARSNGGFYRIALKYGVVGSFAGSTILLGIAAYYYFEKLDDYMAAAFLVAAILNPAAKGMLSWKASYAGNERFKFLSIMEATGIILISGLLMVSVIFYSHSHLLILALALIVPAIQNAILCAFEWNRWKNSPEESEGLKEYGLKTSGYNVLPIIAQEVDRLSIYNFVSPADLALYNVAVKFPEALKSIIQDVGNIVVPKFSRMEKYTNTLNAQLGRLSMILFICISFFTFTIFPYIYRAIVPDIYISSLFYSQILLISIAISVRAMFRAKYIKSQNNIDSFKELTVYSTCAKLITVPILVYFFQIWGAVLAVIIQRIVNIIGIEYIIRKHHIV